MGLGTHPPLPHRTKLSFRFVRFGGNYGKNVRLAPFCLFKVGSLVENLGLASYLSFSKFYGGCKALDLECIWKK